MARAGTWASRPIAESGEIRARNSLEKGGRAQASRRARGRGGSKAEEKEGRDGPSKYRRD
eukprot:5613312-Pleurochrysis_carterae.AAC.1